MKVTVTLTKIGGSRAVILPALWFKQVEEDEMTEVEMEIGNDNVITILPPTKPNKEGGTDGSNRTGSQTGATEAPVGTVG